MEQLRVHGISFAPPFLCRVVVRICTNGDEHNNSNQLQYRAIINDNKFKRTLYGNCVVGSRHTPAPIVNLHNRARLPKIHRSDTARLQDHMPLPLHIQRGSSKTRGWTLSVVLYRTSSVIYWPSLALLVVFATLCAYLALTPNDTIARQFPTLLTSITDKHLHFLACTTLAILLFFSMRVDAVPSTRALQVTLVLGVAGSIAGEMVQDFVSTSRRGDALDALYNVFGVVVGALLAFACRLLGNSERIASLWRRRRGAHMRDEEELRSLQVRA